jgi:hypothetical protein
LVRIGVPMKRDGYLYILRHPSLNFSDWGLREGEYLYKVGVTTRTVEIRLKQHNKDFTKAAGKVVQETGHAWELQDVIAVQDVYSAEKLFWGHTKLADMPFLGGVELAPMRPDEIEKALNELLKLGIGTKNKPK